MSRPATARASTRPARAGLLGLVLLAAACDPRLPDPPAAAPRVQEVEPSGEGVSPARAEAVVTFTAPVSPEGLTDGRRLVLVPAAAERAAVTAVDSDEGAGGLAGAARGTVVLEDGGRRAVLRLSAPLHALVPYVLVVSSRLAGAHGQAVLDAEGHRKATVAPFTTGAGAGPAARPVLAQVRADAETPEAGGEYVILVNRGAGALDLFGWRLEKRSAAGGVTSCVLGEGEVVPGGLALVVGGAYDQRYTLPAGAVVGTCGTSSLLGGLANDRFPSLRLLDPLGAVRSTAGAAGGPACAIALRVELDGADEPGNWECVESD
jgi:hypothetical protein